MSFENEEVRTWYLPYCLKKVEKDYYVILNRSYKPLGMITNDFIDYKSSAIKMKITPKIAAALSYKGDDNVEAIFFYNDGCVPTHRKKFMDDYLEKIAKLAKYKISK